MRVPVLLLLLCGPVLFDSFQRLVQIWTLSAPQVDWIESRYLNAPLLSTLHLLPGLIFFLTGLLQFWPALRIPERRVWHRLNGYAYALCGLISCAAIMVMVFTFPAVGGPLTILGTYLICLGIICCLATALWAARRKDIPLHQLAMAASFTLGLSVATARWLIYGVDWLWEITFIDSFAPASVAAGLINLAVFGWIWHGEISRILKRWYKG